MNVGTVDIDKELIHLYYCEFNFHYHVKKFLISGM